MELRQGVWFHESSPVLGGSPQPLPTLWMAAHVVSNPGQFLCLVICTLKRSLTVLDENGKHKHLGKHVFGDDCVGLWFS